MDDRERPPLLANIVLHELDVYLQQQQRSFARYADDFVICVKSTSAARRVKANVTRFLERRLKLRINNDKSRIVPSKQLEFLGFCFRGTKIAWCDKALLRFKQRVRQLTGRSWGVSLTYRYRELRKYVVGWLNYFALAALAHPCASRHLHIRVQCRNTTDRSRSWMNGYGGACVAAIGNSGGGRAPRSNIC